MTDTMYRFDFRRMRVEDVQNPKPPPGIGVGVGPAHEKSENAGITFSVMGTPPLREIDKE